MQAATPSILCRGVTKSYDLGARTVDALRGVDLAIEGAGFYAIMGASGSGKSTLMHLIAGLDRPTAGSIEVAGVRIDSLGEKDLTLYRRRRIGIVFQHFNLLPSMTALDNVMLPALLDRMDRRAAEKRARELLDELGVSKNTTQDEMESVFRWMYDNLDLWGSTPEVQDQAITIIRQGLINHAVIADPEINLSATMVELAKLQ